MFVHVSPRKISNRAMFTKGKGSPKSSGWEPSDVSAPNTFSQKLANRAGEDGSQMPSFSP